MPEPYRGLDRFVARKKVVADLEALGAIEAVIKIEPENQCNYANRGIIHDHLAKHAKAMDDLGV